MHEILSVAKEDKNEKFYFSHPIPFEALSRAAFIGWYFSFA
jgi:hypothetical protein